MLYFSAHDNDGRFTVLSLRGVASVLCHIIPLKDEAPYVEKMGEPPKNFEPGVPNTLDAKLHERKLVKLDIYIYMYTYIYT